MDVFVRNVPVHATLKQIKNFFREPLAEYGIHDDYHAEKMRDKPLAVITVLSSERANCFLEVYGVPRDSPRHVQARKRLFWNGKVILCSRSRTDPSDFSVKSLAYEASQRAKEVAAAPAPQGKSAAQNATITRFAVQGIKCGVWDYAGTNLAFTQHFADSRQGSVSFGLKGAVILLGGSDSDQCRVDFNYYDCRNIVLGDCSNPTVSITLVNPPKFFEINGEDVLTAALTSMILGPRAAKAIEAKKNRLTSINDEHAKIAGTCFVYQIRLSDYTKLSVARSLLARTVNAPSTISIGTATLFPPESLDRSFVRLNYDLTDTSRFGRLPFSVLFQLYRIARNGVIGPLKVQRLLPTIKDIYNKYGLDAILSTLNRFYRSVPFVGPDTVSSELSYHALEALLHELAAAYDEYKYSPQNPYELVKRYQHINLIHKIIVTPAAIRLEGPDPEPTNRVLRRYAEHSDHFVRVVFQDEDGGSVRYDPRANQDLILHGRFKQILDGNVLIAGRAFSFLGFSHSSLRAQSCWFMAPIFLRGSLLLPEHILRELGDFSNIRVPAKCAARIGQNFTDTNATVDLEPHNVFALATVVRNDRNFSDGVGTISLGLLRRIWRVYGTKRLLKPTALQIRFQGYKGMVSLDSRLQGEMLKLRSNMKKFETTASSNLEICGAAFKPLPMILNRQLIKILEDLHVQPDVFLNLQREAVDKLRYLTTTCAINAASFLEEMDSPKATRMPSLIRHLNTIGFDYREDTFLYRVIEMAVVMKLRDIKYRGRIPVSQGRTLYGIMDETGYLREGEVFVSIEHSPEGGRQTIVKNGVAVTRSPAMHPGDVQVVNAVDVPPDSPLVKLSNVIVFSQHGERDLPSQLSGGDLDGDLYNVLLDAGLIPSVVYKAADYPKITAKELDRAVTRKDMSDFFVDFLETDQLGMLCNIHLQLADQSENGTLDPKCIKLANMASTAVDFSKTGIPVDMKECPKHDRCRPDFMAPSPRVVISNQGHVDVEDEESNDDDPAFEGLDVEKRAIRYYPSNKVLGHLYRAIDEQKFIAKLQQDHRAFVSNSAPTSSLLDKLLEYMKRMAAHYGILYLHHWELAREIRAGYEESLSDILYIYAPSLHMPLSEHEAFAGTILGRKGGAQSKPLRELAKTMKERFEAIVEYTLMRIVKGDEQMQGVGDLDLLYDDNLGRELEALPRAMACLDVALSVPGMVDRQLGELQSFRYVAAGVCLREFERYRITTLGSYVLPRA
ncbi:hypothetical protein LTR37_004947 [Vermiconidia calcicola]|uniref:Uncharacterized protein n=1 Tax=Vermiconidia calcicola TaxID=1690605 RepID=A0ACC3NL19_9PEZI|nr:hypothetical protein LTR37_004947 [Vermiconidia calcicola]